MITMNDLLKQVYEVRDGLHQTVADTSFKNEIERGLANANVDLASFTIALDKAADIALADGDVEEATRLNWALYDHLAGMIQGAFETYIHSAGPSDEQLLTIADIALRKARKHIASDENPEEVLKRILQ